MMVTAKFEGAVWQGANAGRSERFFGPVQPRDSVVPTVVYSFAWIVRFAGVYFLSGISQASTPAPKQAHGVHNNPIRPLDPAHC